MKCKCKKDWQEIRINPIVQLLKHYYRRSKFNHGEVCSPRWTFSLINANW